MSDTGTNAIDGTGVAPGSPSAATADDRTSDPASVAPVAVPVDLAVIEHELAAVEAALARLDDGSYGRCSLCGEPLDDGLLSADPTATACTAHLEGVDRQG